jgi:hypothetical protein
LASEKLKVSNILKDVNQTEQESFCHTINQKMNFLAEDCLNTDNVHPNEAQNAFYKNMMVSLFGRFALHSNFSRHIFVRSAYEIAREASKPQSELIDIFEVSEEMCQIEIANVSKIKPSSEGCLYITSEINALARKFIFEKSEIIERAKGIVLSIDTDAIIYALPPGVDDVLTYGPEFGSFKKVLGNVEIQKFFSLGPRNYSLGYRDANGCDKSIVKVKGLTLSSANNSNILDIKTYNDFVEKRFQNERDNIFIPQMRKKIDKQKKTFNDILTKFDFSNEMHVKRYCLSNDKTFKTYPFGYKFSKEN